MKNLIVAKFIDGSMIKGFTRDFSPKAREFHVYEEENQQVPKTIDLSKLKAVFFVTTTEGKKDRLEKKDSTEQKMYGKPIEVVFTDGETIRGFAPVFNPRDPGFFLFPAEKDSNNERIYINRRATKTIKSFEI